MPKPPRAALRELFAPGIRSPRRRSRPFLPGAGRELFPRWICPPELLSNRSSGAPCKKSLSAKPAAMATSPAPLANPKARAPWAEPVEQIQFRFSCRAIGCWQQMESSADFPADSSGSAGCLPVKDCRPVDRGQAAAAAFSKRCLRFTISIAQPPMKPKPAIVGYHTPQPYLSISRPVIGRAIAVP
jgi:hypothetical protein